MTSGCLDSSGRFGLLQAPKPSLTQLLEGFCVARSLLQSLVGFRLKDLLFLSESDTETIKAHFRLSLHLPSSPALGLAVKKMDRPESPKADDSGTS